MSIDRPASWCRKPAVFARRLFRRVATWSDTVGESTIRIQAQWQRVQSIPVRPQRPSSAVTVAAVAAAPATAQALARALRAVERRGVAPQGGERQ